MVPSWVEHKSKPEYLSLIASLLDSGAIVEPACLCRSLRYRSSQVVGTELADMAPWFLEAADVVEEWAHRCASGHPRSSAVPRVADVVARLNENGDHELGDAVKSFVRAEREANARLADRYSDEEGWDASTSRAIAAAIRART